MAYINSKINSVEHPSKTIVKMVRSAQETGVWPRVLLMTGKEDFLLDWAKKYLKSAIVNPATEALDCITFSENDIDPYAIIAACETVPMMSEKKLIIAEGIDEAAGPLCDYLSSVPETTFLLIINKKINKTKSLYKTVNKIGIVYDFTPLDDATLSGWMAKRFKAAGKSARPEDLVTFARTCGYGDTERNYTLFNLENDLKKIFSLKDKSVLNLEDMMEVSSAQAEINAFKLLDCAFSGGKGDALTILHNSIDIQTPSKEITVIMSFLGLLCAQLEIMVEGKERTEEGQNSYEIVREMKVNEYRLKKAMEACRSKNSKQLRKALDDAFQIEKDLKNGLINGQLALELFIAKI